MKRVLLSLMTFPFSNGTRCSGNAKEVCGDSRVLDIIGGFHLLKPSEERRRGTLEYIKKLGSGCVHACHCTDLNSKIELSKVCRLEEVGAGLQIEYF